MKRAIVLLLAIAAFVCVSGCGAKNTTIKDFAVSTGSETIELGMPMDSISDEVLAAYKSSGVVIPEEMNYDTLNAFLIKKGDAQLGCGLCAGDKISKVISVLGKNLSYDELKNEPFYSFSYYYYERNGKLNGISGSLNTRHLKYLSLDEAEQTYFDKIKDDYMYCDGYSIEFTVRDDSVETIAVWFINNSKFRNE